MRERNKILRKHRKERNKDYKERENQKTTMKKAVKNKTK